MLNMENAEEVMQILERFTRLKQKEIPKELDDYMHYVAKTGDTVFKWSSLKYLFREKLLNVIKNFHDTSPRVDDLPQYPNVDPFNYESMKSSLLERLELFNAAPFTVQRLCELLTEPRKQYSRIDKFMRALEKNILVVSTIEPGRKQTESENGDSLDSVVNGDVSLDVNVDIEMENESNFNAADAPNNTTPSEITPVQPSSNLIHKADDDILPNPKKAKLDLDENNDVETEAATKSITSSKLEPTIPSVEVSTAEDKSDKPTEVKQNEEPVSDNKPAAIENAAAPIKNDNKNDEPEKMEEDLPATTAPASINESKDEVKSDLKESEKKPEESVVAPIPSSTVQETPEESEKSKSAAETVDSKTIHVKTVEKETADKNEDRIQEQTKEVTEKKNTNNEELQNGDVKPSELKTESNITTNDKQSELAAKEKVAASAIETKSEDKNRETAESPVTIAAIEKDVKSEVVPTPAAQGDTKVGDVKPVDEAMTVSEEKSRPAEETNAPIADNTTEKEADTAVQAQTVTESLPTESVAKENEVKSTEVKEKETENPKVADSPEVEAPTTKTTVEPTDAKVVEVPSATPATEKPTVEKSTDEKVEIENLENNKVAVEKPAIEKPEVDTATAEVVPPTAVHTPAVITSTADSPATVASAETKSELATPTTVAKPSEAASTDIPPVTTEPIITADQPMEENPESIAEAQPVVPTIVVEAAATVEEVVMGDSAEMATDAIESAKDEPAGMEVDDTSQEAMDQ